MNRMTVASVQFTHVAGDKQANLRIITDYVTDAADQGIDLIAFPEMCVTGYWHVRNLPRPAIEQLSEKVPGGPTVDALLELSARFGITIGAGLIEQDHEGQLFNSWVIAMPDGRHACHRKLHCFVSEHMQSGNQYTVFDGPHGWRVGILTCWDNNLVENVRMVALQGADLLLAPHQTGGCDSRSPQAMGLIDPRLWQQRHTDPAAIEAEFAGPKGRGWLMRWLPSRAHDNGLFVVFSNGVGQDDNEVRTGNAMILDPYGRILAETGKAANDMVTAELDPELLTMCTGRRWLRGRRPELYGPLARTRGDELDPGTVRFSEHPPE